MELQHQGEVERQEHEGVGPVDQEELPVVDPSLHPVHDLGDPCCGEVDRASCEEAEDGPMGGLADGESVVLEEDGRGGAGYHGVLVGHRVPLGHLASQQRLAAAEFAAIGTAAIVAVVVEPE